MLAKHFHSGKRGAMRRMPLLFLIAAAVPATALAAPRTALGIFEGWGAFRKVGDPALLRDHRGALGDNRTPGDQALCQRRILAEVAHQGAILCPPVQRARAGTRTAPDHRKPPLHPDRQRPARLGERRAHGKDAAIIAAMRSAPSMSVASSTASGRAIADTYRLRGAATAIDAAALGCATSGEPLAGYRRVSAEICSQSASRSSARRRLRPTRVGSEDRSAGIAPSFQSSGKSSLVQLPIFHAR